MMAKNDFTLSEGAYTLCGDDERGYHFVTLGELQPLQELHLAAPGVLSLYLNLRPQPLGEVPLERRVEALLKTEEEKLTEELEAQCFRQAAQRVMEQVCFQYRPWGRGLALFCAPDQALQRTYHLPVEAEDRLIWADQAYLPPLLILMDEYERYGVVLVDHGRARFFLYYLNEVAEYGLALRDELPPRAPDRGSGQLRHLHWLEEQYKQHFHRVAEMLMRLDEHERWPWLALGGTRENISALITELPQSLQSRVAGVFQSSVMANLVEVRDAVAGIEGQV